MTWEVAGIFFGVTAWISVAWLTTLAPVFIGVTCRWSIAGEWTLAMAWPLFWFCVAIAWILEKIAPAG